MAGGGTSEVLETRRVQLDQVDVDGVAGPAAADERVGRERTPQTRDVTLQRGPGRLGRLVLPQRLTEAIDADLSPPGGDEHGQELPALQPVDRHERAVAAHLHWTEHVDGEARHHGAIVAGLLRLQGGCHACHANGRQAASANRQDREQRPPN